MKVGIVLTHPTQFDVPVFRLGHQWIDVIYTDAEKLKRIFDPELNRHVVWEEDNQKGYHFEVVPPKDKFNWLRNKIKKNRYDLLITNGYYTPLFAWSIVLGKRYCKKNALRLDTVEYNNQQGYKKIFKYTLFIALRRLIDYFFVVGTLSRNYLLKNGVQAGKIFTYGYVSNNDFFRDNRLLLKEDKESWRTKFLIKPGAKIILCVSKHNEREAPWDSLHAFGLMEQEGLHLLIVGDGSMHSALVQRSKELGIRNISFAGYLDFSQLPAIYSIASVFVHDSHNEPWGVSVQEAIACDLPVVASDKVGSAVDLVKPGVNGFIFTAGDRQDLASKIGQALQLPEVGLMEYNRQLLQKWNYETVIKNIEAVLNDH
jgi:glycosyltransferase involved in cell wall biosynthesis